MIRRKLPTRGTPLVETLHDGDGYRLLLVEVFNQALRDVRWRDRRAYQAIAWLNQPEVRELALILDVELPSRMTLQALRQNRTPHRESGREVSRG